MNITAHPVEHDLARFTALGVGRITYGPLLQRALGAWTTETLRAWR